MSSPTPKNKKKPVERPMREPDYVSKRGVHYWFSPEFIRGTSSSNSSFGRIKAVRKGDDCSLYMLSKEGRLTFIQGSIQREFIRWHLDRQLDYLILGVSEQEATDMLIGADN